MQEQELQPSAEPFDFVTLYDLDPAKERRAKHLNSVKDFEAEVSPLIESSPHGHVLFLRGHPSPDWLLSIGTKYQVDPEYFQRYLDFFLGQPEHFPLPALPSTALPMIKLRITTIGGSQNPLKTSDRQGDLQDIQGKTMKAKKDYRESLRTHKGCNLGILLYAIAPSMICAIFLLSRISLSTSAEPSLAGPVSVFRKSLEYPY